MRTDVKATTSLLAAFASIALLSVRAVTQEGPYKAAGQIVIGGDGGWDYQTFDPIGRRLYVTHQGRIVVVDPDQSKVVGDITDVVETHEIAIAADLNRGFTANNGENTVNVVDLKTLKNLNKIAVGDRPDGIVYDPGRKEVYTFNDHDHSSTVIDAKAASVVTTVPLSGAPEGGAVDAKAGRVYDNIVSNNVVDVIDTAIHKVVASWPTAPCEGPQSMAIDTSTHRLFIGCRKETMILMDSTNGQVLATLPIPTGVDSAAYDPDRHLVFMACHYKVQIARFDSPDKLTPVQTLETGITAANVALDPKTHRIFLACGEKIAGGGPPRLPTAPGERPKYDVRVLMKLVPDTFKVYVFSMGPISNRQ